MKKILVLNHKSYLKPKEAKKYAIDINDYIRSDQTVIICPSNIYLPYFEGKYNFTLGAQDISYSNITGEVTGALLKETGVKYCLIGHHERKNQLGETSKQINNKIKEALANNITPIIIVGETYYEYEMKKSGEIITKQLKEYLYKITPDQNIIICYEPNWSFQDKQIPTKEHIIEMVQLIKSITKRKFNENIKVLYGGHITKENITKIDKIPILEGYLIGRSSIEVTKIKEIFDNLE
ncbi:MAG: triose-phosphate isomerase [Bacilli bacterium]